MLATSAEFILMQCLFAMLIISFTTKKNCHQQQFGPVTITVKKDKGAEIKKFTAL